MKKNYHLIAVIKAKRKVDYKYRIIDIDNPKFRNKVSNHYEYVYCDKDSVWCRSQSIGGLYYRNEPDRSNSFRYDKHIPIIDGEVIVNMNSIMQCSERIFVNYMGIQLMKQDYPNEYHVVDARTDSQKKSYNRSVTLRKKALSEDLPEAVMRDLIAIRDSDMTQSQYKKYLSRRFRNKSR